MKDYTMLFKTIYLILSIVISAYILPKLESWLKTKIDEAKYNKIIDIIKQAVKAFEEMYKEQHGMGQIKKAGVIEFVKNALSNYGITVDDDFLNKMIDALVFEMNEKRKSNESD